MSESIKNKDRHFGHINIYNLFVNFIFIRIASEIEIDGWPEVDDELNATHFELDYSEDAQNQFVNLARKMVALYNVYFTPISKVLRNYKDIVNDILDDKRKIITDFDLMVNSMFNSIMNEENSVVSELNALTTEPFKNNSPPETIFPGVSEIFAELPRGTLVGGGPFWNTKTTAQSSATSGSSSASSVSSSSSSASTETKGKFEINFNFTT